MGASNINIINNLTTTSTHGGLRKGNLAKLGKAGYAVFDEAQFYIDSKYQIQEVLGKGSYGTVCSAVDFSKVERPVSMAIKKVSNIFNKEILLKRAVRELKLMRFFKGHRNVRAIP